MHTQTITTSTIAVNYGRSLRDMIADGKYDWVDSDITPERFPLIPAGTVQFETKLFHFPRGSSSKDAVGAIEADDPSHPWKPAAIEHLLAFGAKNTEEQRQYPIIGLGSVAKVFGSRYVPYLCRFVAKRDLNLYWWDDDWRGGCRFLAVRPLSSAA